VIHDRLGLDLAWLPEGTPESDLPEGFSFSR
jgi:hypothetical protein